MRSKYSPYLLHRYRGTLAFMARLWHVGIALCPTELMLLLVPPAYNRGLRLSYRSLYMTYLPHSYWIPNDV